MSILSTIYTRSGESLGQPIIVETGVCTNDTSTMSQLRAYENEALQVVRVPRRSGLTAKNLAGSAPPRTRTISDEHVGRFENCIQLGRTETQLSAPRQPIGPHQGKCILTYQRQWLCLSTQRAEGTSQTIPGSGTGGNT